MSIGATRSSCLTEKKMKRIPRPCLTCGVLTTNSSRCDTHQTAHAVQKQMRQDADPNRRAKKSRLYNSNYQALARGIRATATHCYLCLLPFAPHNPVQVDHLYPSMFERSPLLPACGRCNRRKANKDLDKIDSVDFPGKDAAVRLYPPAGTL